MHHCIQLLPLILHPIYLVCFHNVYHLKQRANMTKVMILPLRLLSHLRMSGLQKIGLSFLFCLGTLVIIMSIARTVRTNAGKNGALATSDPRWVALWSSAEETTAIIVCCLPAIRKLFTSRRDSRTFNVSRPWSFRPIVFPRWSLRLQRKTETEMSHSTGHRSLQLENGIVNNYGPGIARPAAIATKNSRRMRSRAEASSSSSSQEELYNGLDSPDSRISKFPNDENV